MADLRVTARVHDHGATAIRAWLEGGAVPDEARRVVVAAGGTDHGAFREELPFVKAIERFSVSINIEQCRAFGRLLAPRG